MTEKKKKKPETKKRIRPNNDGLFQVGPCGVDGWDPNNPHGDNLKVMPRNKEQNND